MSLTISTNFNSGRALSLQVLTLKLDELLPGEYSLSPHPAGDLRWLKILHAGLRQEPLLLRAVDDLGKSCGELPVVFVKGPLFGRFLVSLPYINSGGVQSNDPFAEKLLIDRAIELTDQFDCRYLELRHERPVEHPGLNAELTSKVHMRLKLTDTVEELRAQLKSKVRNQLKKGESHGFTVVWGGMELLNDFYKVFAIRMRDLGTPVYSRKLFASILNEFDQAAEICCVRDGETTIAVALLIHGSEVTEVPSASALSRYHRTNANMMMYWQLLARSIERGQKVFDFGRSTMSGPTYKFKQQWGAEPHPAHWQYYLREGAVDDMRPDSGNKKKLIELWKRLPVWVTRILGPMIVRGIP